MVELNGIEPSTSALQRHVRSNLRPATMSGKRGWPAPLVRDDSREFSCQIDISRTERGLESRTVV